MVIFPKGFTQELGCAIVNKGNDGAFNGGSIVAIVEGELHPEALSLILILYG